MLFDVDQAHHRGEPSFNNCAGSGKVGDGSAAPAVGARHASALALANDLQAVYHASRCRWGAIFAKVEDKQRCEDGKKYGIHDLRIGPPACTIARR